MKITKDYLRKLIREGLEEVESIGRNSKLAKKVDRMAKRVPSTGKIRVSGGREVDEDPFGAGEFDPMHIQIVQLKSVAGALNKSGSKADITFPGYYVRMPHGDLKGPFDSLEAAKKAAYEAKAGTEKHMYTSLYDDEDEG